MDPERIDAQKMRKAIFESLKPGSKQEAEEKEKMQVLMGIDEQKRLEVQAEENPKPMDPQRIDAQKMRKAIFESLKPGSKQVEEKEKLGEELEKRKPEDSLENEEQGENVKMSVEPAEKY